MLPAAVDMYFSYFVIIKVEMASGNSMGSMYIIVGGLYFNV
jgi:hypothetical protein